MYHSLRFTRKTLILAISGMVLTLITLGIVLTTYFLYAQSISVFSINPLPVATFYKENSIDGRSRRNHSEKHRNYQHIKRIEKATNRTGLQEQSEENLFSNHKQVTENDIKSQSFVLSKSKEENYAEHFRHFDNQQDHLGGKSSKKSIESSRNQSEAKDTLTGAPDPEKMDELVNKKNHYNVITNSNTETIYIDDYDRIWDNSGITSAPSGFNSITDQLDINNVEYLESYKDYSPSEDKPLLNRLLLQPSSYFKKTSDLSIYPAKSSSRPRKTSRGHRSDESKLPEFYRSFFVNRKNSENSRKRLAANAQPNKRRQSNLYRYSLVDDDDTYRSDEELDNESTGSGSGDFISENSEPTKNDSNTVVIFDTTGKHKERYRIETKSSENIYKTKNKEALKIENLVTFNSTANDHFPMTNFVLHTFHSSHTINGTNPKKWMPPSIVSNRESRLASPSTILASASSTITTAPSSLVDSVGTPTRANEKPKSQQSDYHLNSGAWLETRARRIMGNVKKSEERSRQLLLCAEAGGGELCRMLFKGHLN